MTDKAYIVANEQQEREVLEQLEKEVFMWIDHTNKPTEFVPSIEVSKKFPYAIVVDMNISLKLSNYFEHYEIVYDGRKEERMSEKYVVSQEFMDELEEWKNNLVSSKRIYPEDISELYSENVIRHWWQGDGGGTDANNRLIAIIRWVNGEDVFEVEKPKKWVVRSKGTDIDDDYAYVRLPAYNVQTTVYGVETATKFDTKEEAESWANAHQEVVEVVDV